MGYDLSADKGKIEILTKKVDELVLNLNGIMEDLRQVSASLRSLAVTQITQPIAAHPAPALSESVAGAPKSQSKSKALEDVRMLFPEDMDNLLGFEEKDDYILIRPRQFLGPDNFSKIASIVRNAGGEYVSAGKASHFRIPKTQT
jgi:hypothetical protein